MTLEEDPGIAVAVRPVREFAEAYNRWEREMAKAYGGRGQSSEAQEAASQQYYAVIAKYFTQRKRVLSGHPFSWGTPRKFEKVEENPIVSAQLARPGRAEVVVATSYFDQLYMFVIARKFGEWRIDSIKRAAKKAPDSWKLASF